MKTRVLLLASLVAMLACAATALAAQVTFQVNMSAQVVLGNFNPASDALFVAGDPLNGWSTTDSSLVPSGGDANVCVGTFEVTGTPGNAAQYKFVMNGGTWEGNVGPNGAQNRALTLGNTAQILPVVFFNHVTAVPQIIPVTFQVHLGMLIAKGSFDPDTGMVSVAGDPLNNWDASVSLLARSGTDPNLWTGTIEVTGTAGAGIRYKFVLNGSTWEGNVGPDGTQNRSYTLASTDPPTVPVAHFNNLDNLDAVSLGSLAGGQLTLSWTAGPWIRLQTATDLHGSAWQHVPHTLGQSSATVAVPGGSARSCFQSVGP